MRNHYTSCLSHSQISQVHAVSRVHVVPRDAGVWAGEPARVEHAVSGRAVPAANRARCDQFGRPLLHHVSGGGGQRSPEGAALGRRTINPGDEIFVYYGNEYHFGDDIDDKRQGWIFARSGRPTGSNFVFPSQMAGAPPAPPHRGRGGKPFSTAVFFNTP